MPASITIQRLPAYNKYLNRMKIFIDGQLVYRLSNGETVNGELASGEHEIVFKLGFAKTSSLIKVESGRHYNYTVVMHPILPKIEFRPAMFG